MASSLPASPIELLNHLGAQVVVVVSGGGTQVIPQLLAEGGASNVMLEVLVPYAKSAIAEFLGGNPESYCSDSTTRQLAVAGWQRSIKLSSQGSKQCWNRCNSKFAIKESKNGSSQGACSNAPGSRNGHCHIATDKECKE